MYQEVKLILNPLDQVSQYEPDSESHDYMACSFELNGKKIIFRKGKITPTKVGQFVTFWKREGAGPIMPFDFEDSFDSFMVFVKAENKEGLFLFPKSVLLEKGILSLKGKGGKRAFRLYPPWDKADNAQAKKSQAWQLGYFNLL